MTLTPVLPVVLIRELLLSLAACAWKVRVETVNGPVILLPNPSRLPPEAASYQKTESAGSVVVAVSRGKPRPHCVKLVTVGSAGLPMKSRVWVSISLPGTESVVPFGNVVHALITYWVLGANVYELLNV